MKYYLMDKNTEIALIEYDTNLNVISKIYKKINFEYAPLNLYANQNRKDFNLEKEMNRWFKGRGIPSWRKDLERLLKNLNVKFSDELLDKAYGLSLSDQYWINPTENKLKWKDINFFTNDFEYKAFLDASILNKSSRNISLMTPNNTTDGMIQKAWIIENRKRKLIKGTFYNANQEPLNEKLTSIICRYLGFDYCNYEIEVLENKLVSKCEDFVNENTEYITAYDILQTKKKSNNISTYEHYIKILEENGIENARINIENMLLIDFLVMNIDIENEFKIYEDKGEGALNLIKINYKENMPLLYYTNIILYDNTNQTLPEGMDLSTQVLVDTSRFNFKLVGQNKFRTNNYFRESDNLILPKSKDILVYEYDVELKKNKEEGE